MRFAFQKAHTVHQSRSNEETETTQQSGEVSYPSVLTIEQEIGVTGDWPVSNKRSLKIAGQK